MLVCLFGSGKLHCLVFTCPFLQHLFCISQQFLLSRLKNEDFHNFTGFINSFHPGKVYFKRCIPPLSPPLLFFCFCLSRKQCLELKSVNVNYPWSVQPPKQRTPPGCLRIAGHYPFQSENGPSTCRPLCFCLHFVMKFIRIINTS